jgi:hypothetical protein
MGWLVSRCFPSFNDNHDDLHATHLGRKKGYPSQSSSILAFEKNLQHNIKYIQDPSYLVSLDYSLFFPGFIFRKNKTEKMTGHHRVRI